MAELSAASFFYSLSKDLLKLIRGRRRNLSAEDRFASQQKWRDILESELSKCRNENLRHDIIIHDVKRPKFYPGGEPPEKGISPWFRVYFADMYHKGIAISSGIHELSFDEQFGGWYLAEDLSKDYVKADLISYIPYEQIVHVDIDGDEYYSYPHLFCYFDIGGTPYEKSEFCLMRGTAPNFFFEPIASADDVHRASLKAGTRPFKNNER
jgi:hypothetical protein